ncbi:MAG TPA: pyruvate dehydrogenase (acetyl-transferring), homodimeric type [Gammaproteobacteria bacterium]|nr:pyruvate dehydrogenase (acetyl-transferring), homodimeric type [Gammaproteobacteria bacterium]
MANQNNSSDIDPIETKEWFDALSSVIKEEGKERAAFLVNALLAKAAATGIPVPTGLTTSHINTIPVDQEEKMPAEGPEAIALRALIRWNAVIMVLRAGEKDPALGGHLATYASAAILYEVGFNYFFRGRTENRLEDLVYIQGHSAPGIYARAFLEGRLSEEQLEHFRREMGGIGLSSYPHPFSMPDFWQFPTVSMGLGPLQAIYQARFLKYLENRGLLEHQGRKVWAFLGDGEMDEVDSLGGITVAAREQLDNLIFVVNCNLQRLDGPVRGNGHIMEELESLFRGAGWNVIKVVWGGRWDELLAKDKTGLLVKRMNECVDGEYQNFRAKDGAYVREHFFGKYPELLELVKDMSDEDIWHLNRGGHDPQKVYAAYAQAVKHQGQPTIILAKTIKGYGLGAAGEGQNIAHNAKKMAIADLKVFSKRFNLSIPEEKISALPFIRPDSKSPEIQFLQARREALGGYLPKRFHDAPSLETPPLSLFDAVLKGSEDREISTTMAFVRVLMALLKDKNINQHIVPIVADESRTFGMEGLFRQIGIYSVVGQLYEPEDKAQVMYYRESKDGQILQEGLSEAGSFCSWLAAGTSYSSNALQMIPFYIFYSMFGFQRIGDYAWAAGDIRARGFLLGSLAGRTTLAGEGLQHDDGHSLILSSVIPSCISYDPTFGYEVAVIIQHGLQRMCRDQEDVYYYLTLMNENYTHPAMPKGVEEGIIKGLYLLQKGDAKAKLKVQLLGSGAILREVIAAAKLLAEYGVSADVWSATSMTELRREALAVERYNRLHPKATPKVSYVTSCLQKSKGPVIAATDYMKLYADQIRAFVPRAYHVLGTDGYGPSDTRHYLREHFEVSAQHIAYTALLALANENQITEAQLMKAQKKLGINADAPDPARV